MQANVAAAVLQVVLVAAAFVASKRLNSWYRLSQCSVYQLCSLQDAAVADIDAQCDVRVPVFCRFLGLLCFVRALA